MRGVKVDKEKVLKYWDKGYKQWQIVQLLGINRHTVYEIVKNAR